jgi:hypothetical protein
VKGLPVSNEGLWDKVRAYIDRYNGQIMDRANYDIKVLLALDTLLLVDMYQTMALALAPKCPEEFKAQVDAVKGTLDKVMAFLHSEGTDRQTNVMLINDVSTGLSNFLQFLGRCAGFEVKVVEAPDQTEGPSYCHIRKYIIADKPLPFETLVLPESQKAIEIAMNHARAFDTYHSQLVEYIWSKTGWAWVIPLALMGLEASYLYNDLALLFMFRCPWLFTGKFLQETVNVLKHITRVLSGNPDSQPDVYTDFITWRKDFIEAIAQCFGVYIEVKPIPGSNGMEMAVVKYEPITSQCIPELRALPRC